MTTQLTTFNQFANEEVPSNCMYPEEYKGFKPIKDQINIITKSFNFDPNYALELADGLPPLESFVPADVLPWIGWSAIPKWDRIALTYGEAVKKVLAMIASKREFDTYRKHEFPSDFLRQCERTIHAFDQIVETQKGDILIFPAQFGFLHRGRSARRAREVFAANEFGLGPFAVGIMLMTHPERLAQDRDRDLSIVDCIGDEVFFDRYGWQDVPFFCSKEEDSDKIFFGMTCFVDVHPSICSASAFLPAVQGGLVS